MKGSTIVLASSLLFWSATACKEPSREAPRELSTSHAEAETGLTQLTGPIHPIVLSVLEMDRSVWMAGGERGAHGGRILRVQDGHLGTVTVPSGPTLWWIWRGIGGQLHATGESGRILTGSVEEDDWTQERPLSDIRVTFWGGWTSPQGILWVVGGSRDLHGPKGILLSREPNGDWTRHDTASLGVDGNLYKVWGRSDNSIFFVGENGICLHWNGLTLERQANPAQDMLFTIHGASHGLILAVGGTVEGRVLRHDDDGVWRQENIPAGVPPLSGVFVRENGEAVAVGERGTILMRSPDGVWTRRRDEILRNLPGVTLHGASFESTLWAVGGDFSAGGGGVILTQQGTVSGAILARDSGEDHRAMEDVGVDVGRPVDGMAVPLDFRPLDADIQTRDMHVAYDGSAQFDAAQDAGSSSFQDFGVVEFDADLIDANVDMEGCGNGRRTAGEECDDSNQIDGDGCSANCRLECGNGQLEGREVCDDGNRQDGDGCDARCQLECGNGEVTDLEECDDGNLVAGDGCDSACRLECGNGRLDGDEACDDNARDDGDGCDRNCRFECGNARPNLGEECDDGNRVDGDGCSADCRLESPGAGEACEAAPCQPGFECLGVAIDDFFPVCTVRCDVDADCPRAGFTEAVRCDLIGPQLIDTYCVPERCYDGDCDEDE